MSFAISVVGHAAALLVALIYAGANPFESVPADAITVDIVTPDDLAAPVPEPTKPENPFDIFTLSMQDRTSASASAPPADQPNKPSSQPSPQQSQPSQQSRQSAQQQQQRQQSAPEQSLQQKPAAQASSRASQSAVRQAMVAPVQPGFAPEPEAAPSSPSLAERPPSSFADVFAMPITLPDGRVGGTFDAVAYDSAKIDAADRNAFRDHLKTCSKLPSAVSPGDHVRIVLRVAFKRDGTLASLPDLVEASGSPAKGLPLKESAIRALKACQPYTMLPSDKYDEWKVIDMTFTPDDFAGG